MPTEARRTGPYDVSAVLECLSTGWHTGTLEGKALVRKAIENFFYTLVSSSTYKSIKHQEYLHYDSTMTFNLSGWNHRRDTNFYHRSLRECKTKF